METLIEQPPVVAERLLIFTKQEEIDKIVEDAKIRERLLNDMLACGLSHIQIKDVAVSEKAIEQYIFSEQLKVNKALAVQFAAGKRNLIGEYALPENLENIQRLLLQFLHYPKSQRAVNKYDYLKFNGRYELDSEALEREFILRRLKFFIEGADVVEYRRLESMLEYFQDHRCPNNQVALISFLSDRFESVGQFKYKVRWTYFNRDRN